jgi:hypothetical protein
MFAAYGMFVLAKMRRPIGEREMSAIGG